MLTDLARAHVEAPHDADWGLPLLARIAGGPAASDAVLRWAGQHRGGVAPAGLYSGGLAGLAVGLYHATAVEPRLAGLATTARDRLADWTAHQPPPAATRSAHYDIVNGMSGALLALVTTSTDGAEPLRAAADWLTALTEPDLTRLRHTPAATDDAADWNAGQYNLGLSHGAPGVLAALVQAYPRIPSTRLQAAIRRLADGVRNTAVRNAQAVTTWHRASGPVDPAIRPRQAWCYGTPGVAWALADAGRVLDDPGLTSTGVAAMESLCAAWDDDHVTANPTAEALAFCHGISGVLAVSDAFATHHHSAPARRLADHLAGRLRDALGQEGAAMPTRALDGIAGTLAVLIGDGVDWQIPFALHPSAAER